MLQQVTLIDAIPFSNEHEALGLSGWWEGKDCGREKIVGGRKSNVSDKTLCFFVGWQNSL